jgi:hypothetical protein
MTTFLSFAGLVKKALLCTNKKGGNLNIYEFSDHIGSYYICHSLLLFTVNEIESFLLCHEKEAHPSIE